MKETSQEIMLQIGDTLISLDVIEKKFICDIVKCHGACCVEGDSGAPLEESEIQIIENSLEKIVPFLSPQGQESIRKQGVWFTDKEGDRVTVLNHGKECAFTVFENGIAVCGIEKAYEAGEITFQKPISCHLYPIRLKKYPSFTAVNYDTWDLCKAAVLLGNKEKKAVYQFLKPALTRKFGTDWYEELELAAEQLNSSGND